MNLSSSEISSILKEQIEKFDLEAKVEEIGKFPDGNLRKQVQTT